MSEKIKRTTDANKKTWSRVCNDGEKQEEYGRSDTLPKNLQNFFHYRFQLSFTPLLGCTLANGEYYPSDPLGTLNFSAGTSGRLGGRSAR